MNYIKNIEKTLYFDNSNFLSKLNVHSFLQTLFILKSLSDFYKIQITSISDIQISIENQSNNTDKLFIIFPSDSSNNEIYKIYSNIDVKLTLGGNVNSSLQTINYNAKNKLNFIVIELIYYLYKSSVNINSNIDIIQNYFKALGENIEYAIKNGVPDDINSYTLPSFDELFSLSKTIFSSYFDIINSELPLNSKDEFDSKDVEQKIDFILNDKSLETRMNEMISSFSYYINSLKGIPSIYKFPKIESIVNKVYPKNEVNYLELESAFNYMLMGGNIKLSLNLIKEYFKFKCQCIMQSEFAKIKNSGRNLTFSLEQVRSVDNLTALENVVGKFLYGRKRNYEQNKTVRNLVKAYSNKDDITFYTEIHKYYNPVDFDRSKARMKEFDEINLKINNVKMYLDFGGGDGANAYALGKKLNLKKGEVFVSDIESWFGNANVDKFKELCTYRYLKTYLLPFETESFDLITMFQVLHHIENVSTVLKELYRILKVGGIFYIREHDCDSLLTATLIDIEHSLQECSKKSNIDYEYLQTYYANYFSREELREELFNVGFKEYMRDGKHVTSLNYGETRYYITVWTK